LLRMLSINHRFLILLFFTCVCAFGQEQVALNDYFSTIEDHYQVNFNYIEQEVEGVRIDPYKGDKNLTSVLQAISSQAPFTFDFLDDTNIVVSLAEVFYAIRVVNSSNSAVNNAGIYFNLSLFGTTNSKGLFYYTEDDHVKASNPYSSSNGFAIFADNHKDEYVLPGNLKKNKITTIRLTQQIELSGVDVIGYLTKGISLNRDFSISLQPKEFEILPGLTQPDVIRTMQLLPGVISLDERISNLNVRGGTHDQNLFLWNGARLYQTGHFFGMISALNPSIAHDIKIYKNGSSSFFTEGISSVIDISSSGHKSNNTDFEFFINFLESSARADIALSDSSHLRVAGRYALSGLIDTPTFQNYYDKIFQNTEITSFTTSDDISLSSDVDLNYYDTSIQFENDINATTSFQVDLLTISNLLEFSEQNLNTLEVKDNSLRQESYIASAGIQKQWSSVFSTSGQSYVSYYRLRGENALTQSNQQLNQTNKVLDFGLKLRGDLILSKPHVLSFGYQFSEIGVDNNNLVTNPDVEINQKSIVRTHSAVAELSSNFYDNKLSAVLGLRTNFYDAFSRFVVEPHLNLTYRINSRHSLSFMAEQKHQITSQSIDLQNDFFGVENRRWILADDDVIPIQQLRQAELGYKFINNDLLITANVFYKKVSGISSNSQNFLNQLELLQLTGDYTTKGLEVFLQQNIQRLKYWISYAYNDSNYDFSSFLPSVFPNNFETSHQVHFGFSYVTSFLKFGVSAQYFTGRPITPIDEDMPVLNQAIDPEINFLSPNSENLGDYKQVNVTASYYDSWKRYTYELGLSILNVFDSSDITNQFYRLDNNAIRITNMESRSLALTPNVFFRLNF